MFTLLTFKMTSSQYFVNISVQISPNNNELDIFEIYTEREVGKCPRWTFLTIRKLRKSINKSGNSFDGHPVVKAHLKDCAMSEFIQPHSFLGSAENYKVVRVF